MKIHHTKNKGDIGVLKACADIAEQGYLVLTPLSEHSPFDLVAYKEKSFLRIQVKYRSAKNGRLLLDFRSSYSDKNGAHSITSDKTEIDYYCIYCPDTNECYYLNPDHFEKAATLRVEPTKNNQSQGIHIASQYRKLP